MLISIFHKNVSVLASQHQASALVVDKNDQNGLKFSHENLQVEIIEIIIGRNAIAYLLKETEHVMASDGWTQGFNTIWNTTRTVI